MRRPLKPAIRPAGEPAILGVSRASDETARVDQAPRSPLRIVIIEDQVVVRSGLCKLIESRPHLQVVGEVGLSPEARALAVREQADVIVVDPDPPCENGLNLLPHLRTSAPKPGILVLTSIKDPQWHRRAVQFGAIGVVMKTVAADTFLNAIERVSAGEAWLSRSMTASLLLERSCSPDRARDLRSESLASLSKREREVVDVVCEGLRNEEIAQRLFISEVTVRHHLTSIFAKLGIPSRAGLIAYAYRNGQPAG